MEALLVAFSVEGKQAKLFGNRAPNHSIELTVNGLRPSPAAHVKR
jgi:hypothetical protein